MNEVRAAAEKGIIFKREVPTAEMYKEHQLAEVKISTNAIGGQYMPIFLKQYFHRNRLPFNILSYLSTPREWHGAPLAAIRRAIPILGSARLKAIDRKIRLELEQLRDLYFFDDDEGSPAINYRHPTTLIIQQERKRLPEEDQGSPKKRTKNSAGLDYEEGTTNGGGQALGTRQCPILRGFPPDWVLGPDLSTEEVVRRYAPLFARG